MGQKQSRDLGFIKRFTTKALYLLLIIVFTPLVAELVLRWNILTTPNESQSGGFFKVIQERINYTWTKGSKNRKVSFEPPWEVYVNRNFDDELRLKEIRSNAYSMQPGSWTVSNFLRPDDPSGNDRYTVTINNIGLRGKDFDFKKPANTIRILALGSYPTFGHGLNDSETYPHYLESKLQKIANAKGKKIEVWNAGLQGGTAIMGYVYLKYELERINPDIITWDYGWIEMYLKVDMAEVTNRLTVSNSITNSASLICHSKSFYNFKLCELIRYRTTKLDPSVAISGWMEANRRAIDLARASNTPLIFLRHDGISIPLNWYDEIKKNTDIVFVDTAEKMANYSASKEQVAKYFAKNESWLSEIGVTPDNLLNERKGYLLRIDAIQYNSIAMEIIAETIVESIVGNDLL